MDETTPARPKLTTVLFDDDGRLARKPYWLLGVLAPTVALFLLWFLVTVALRLDLRNHPAAGLVYVVNTIVLVVAYCVWVWIFIVTTMKRLHDRGMSGWWFWIVLVPAVGWLILLIMCAIAGDEGPNAYGPVPAV